MNQAEDGGPQRGNKGREAFRTISEVAEQLDLPQHVLRFWESKFSQIKPLKRGGNRRYYRPDDVTLLTAIKKLLHSDGYTIRGVQKLFKAQGVKATIALALDENGAGALAASISAANQSEAEAEENQPESTVAEPKDSGGINPDNIRVVLARLKGLRDKLE